MKQCEMPWRDMLLHVQDAQKRVPPNQIRLHGKSTQPCPIIVSKLTRDFYATALPPDRQNRTHNSTTDDVVTGIDGPEFSRWRLPDVSHGQRSCAKSKTDTGADFQPPQQIHMASDLMDYSGEHESHDQVANQSNN